MIEDLPGPSFFTLTSFHGGVLARSPNGCLNATVDEAGADPVLLFVPDDRKPAAFLVGHDTLRIEGDPWRRGCALGFRLNLSGGIARLQHPSTGRYLAANPPPEGIISVDRVDPCEWEGFVLGPVAVPPPGVRALAERLEAILDLIGPDNPPSALWRVIDPALLRAAVEAGPPFLLERLASAARADPALAHALAEPGDPWLQVALPRLADWLASGRPSTRDAEAGPDWDFLAHAGEQGAIWSLGQRLNHLARRSVVPSRGPCIIATARNEGPFLLEWLAYHRALGFEHIYLTSNDNDDGSDELLAALAASGAITWIKSRIEQPVRPQCKAYSHALQLLPDPTDHDWAAIIDLDEFVVLNRESYPTIGDYLRWQERQPVDAIALNWRLAGTRGGDRWRDEPVALRFPSTTPDPDGHAKAIIRPSRFMHSHPHRPYPTEGTTAVFRDAAGHETPISAYVPHNFEHAWINHYIYKSAEEFAWRRMRNRGDDIVQSTISINRLDSFLIGTFFAHRDRLIDHVGRSEAHMAPAIGESELQRLMALPKVATARARVIAAFRRELAEMHQLVDGDPRFAIEGSAERRFAEALLGG